MLNIADIILLKAYQLNPRGARARIATVSRGSLIGRVGGVCSAVLLANLLVAPGTKAAGSGSETGVWVDDTGQGAIEIAPCGAKLCGRIVWLKQPLGASGKPEVDSLNPAPAKRTKPVCGLQVIGDLTRQSDGTWDAGWVYDPKVGESYDLSVTLKDANRLTITGYKGLKMFGKQFTWTRSPSALPSCVGKAQ
jgi:uncharacterized protein (DUF2147 family)